MKRYKLCIAMLIISTACLSQHTEREHRIRKSQFPALQNNSMLYGQKTRQVLYYKEVDSLETTYLLKFKRDRLHYYLSFNDHGYLKNSGFRIKELDIPEETAKKIKAYLSESFEKFRIRRIFQQYPATSAENNESLLSNTFQNLLLSTNVYKLFVNGTNEKKKTEYDLWFSADGNLIRKRKALPMNHDRILY